MTTGSKPIEGELLPLPRGQEFIDEEALDRYRFNHRFPMRGHDMAGVNYNTLWRLVATIDHLRALTKATDTDGGGVQ
jgi:hypothetical protein